MQKTILEIANEARTRIQEISAEEADRRVAAGAVLIDVRDEREFRTGHISGAIRVSGESLKAGISGLVADFTTPIVCYCALGHRSAIAADTLQRLGYRQVASIEGGLKSYLANSVSRKIA